jgi:uncharacterized protein
MIIIHSMHDPVPRLIEQALRRASRVMPVVIVTGARQTGKSTLVRDLVVGEDRLYLTLDDLDVLDQAQRMPDDLVSRSTRITLDEVQRAPELLLAVKQVVDQRRRKGQFFLTGSANLLLMQGVSESLAGRAAYLTLWPLTRREQLGLGRAGIWDELLETADEAWPGLIGSQDVPREEWRSVAARGGYPVPALDLDSQGDRDIWFRGYVRTYLERDLQEISSVTALPDLRRLMRAACLRLGNLVNQTELGRDVALPQPTVHRYLNLLETSYQLVRVPAYSVNRTRRLIRTPKLYWADTGLALHLAELDDPEGSHLENLILGDLLAWREGRPDRADILYWRTAVGDEVDFVIETSRSLIPVEVKATAKPRQRDAKGLRAFREEYPDLTRTGLLLHTGSRTEWLGEGILAAPWWRVI